MRYYVIWHDGQKFGPGEEKDLVEWYRDGRLSLDMELEEADSGKRIKAGELEILRNAPYPGQPQTETPQGQTDWSTAPGPSATYYRPSAGPIGDYGSGDISASWTLSGLGLSVGVMSMCCCQFLSILTVILPIFGLVMANRGLGKGHPSGSARVFAIFAIVVTALIGIAGLVISILLFSGGLRGNPFMPR